MRHGRKSSTKAFNGYKRYIATMVDVPLILCAETKPANVPECEALPSVLELVAVFGELASLYIDRGFLAHEEITKLDRRGMKICCRPWQDTNSRGRFSRRAGRSVHVHEQESLLRRLAKRGATKQGRRSLRPRVAVEHRLARIAALQTGRARYKGTRKNTLDLRRHAAVANLLEINTALTSAGAHAMPVAA